MEPSIQHDQCSTMFDENQPGWQRNVNQGNSQSHSGYKSYFIKDVTGAIHKCTTEAFFVPDLQHDLLGGRALVTANYQLILDKDPKISGLFSVTNGKIDPANGLLFLDLEGLFFVETVPLFETQFKK